VNRRNKLEIGTGIAIVCAALIFFFIALRKQKPITLTGVVISQDSDPRKQSPIIGVEISEATGLAPHSSQSDSSGLFHLTLRRGVRSGQPLMLKFRHPDYKPTDLTQLAGHMLYVIRMSPISPATKSVPGAPTQFISQVSIRYSVKASTIMDIGSAAKTFEVINTGNVICRGQSPCSPDGRWKATAASLSLDAGEGNAFQHPRVSCIAGPCPFTTIDSNDLAENNRVFKVSVRDWSDPATFLVEAEVVHPTTGEIVRQSYPAILGRNLNFTLPVEVEGVSIEAEVNGTRVVFPLGPELCLSWAECNLNIENDRARTYRCELRPGFEFR
jgi:hypothetical protein